MTLTQLFEKVAPDLRQPEESDSLKAAKSALRQCVAEVASESAALPPLISLEQLQELQQRSDKSADE